MCDWPGYVSPWREVLEQMDAEDDEFMRAQHDYMVYSKSKLTGINE